VASLSTLLPPSTGLDTCLSIMKVLHNGLGEGKYRPCPLLQAYVDAGWLGQKVGWAGACGVTVRNMLRRAGAHGAAVKILLLF
jgi:3-hydroxyacyl-CoA dehydrogenase